jgi:chromosome segregation ATPase
MEASSPVPQTVQIETEKDDRTCYVEELAGEGDYWLSITDAARVCRVQDVSIRRAIARGALPVRRQRAGQNKRTRLVRASDLPGAGFPIIDESAAITTEVGKADILSIPRQQQRILQDHQQLTLRFTELQNTLANSQALLLANLQQQKEETQAALQSLQREQAQQLAATETRLLAEQEKLQHYLLTLEQRLEQEAQRTLQGMARLQEEALQRESNLRAELQAQQASFETYQRVVQQMLDNLEARQQQRLEASQQAMQERFQQGAQESRTYLRKLEQQITGALEQQAQNFAGHLAVLAEQLAQLRRFSEQIQHDMLAHGQALERTLEQKQEQLERLARLLPLLPYVEKRLLTEQDEVAWKQALATIEGRVFAEVQRQLVPYQPLLTLLSTERLESLVQLLDERRTRPEVPPLEPEQDVIERDLR